MKCVKLLAALVLTMVMTTVASAANIELSKSSTINTILNNKELRIGFNASYPPFEMSDKQGNFIGFDVDLGKEIAKAMGVKARFINMDFDGLIPALQSDKFDIIISGMTLTQSRNLKIAFSDPYILMGQGVMVNAAKKDVVKFYRDLNKADMNVVSCIGTTGEEAVKKYLPKAQYKSFDQPSDSAQEVIAGRADALVYDLHVLEVLQARQGGDKTFILNEPFTFEPMAIGFKQGDPDFTNFLNNFLFQFKSDGRYERIHNKWLQSNKWEKLIDG